MLIKFDNTVGITIDVHWSLFASASVDIMLIVLNLNVSLLMFNCINNKNFFYIFQPQNW